MKNVFAFRYVLAFATVSVLSASCDKDEKSKTDLLTAKSWKLSESGRTMKLKGVDIDEFGDLPECLTDEVITFNKDKSYNQQPGSILCYVDESLTTGTWSWKENETVLSTIADGKTQDLPILTLTKTTLKLDLGTELFDFDNDGDEDEVILFNEYIH